MRYTRNICWTLVLAVLVCAGTGALAAPLADSPNGGWDAAWSPDGTRIAFTSGSPHSIPNLWTVGVDGKGLRQMTTRGAHEPQWMPDGKTIVFGTIRRGASVFMAIDASGEPGSEKLVDVLPHSAEGPVWSPDGSLVAYVVTSPDGSSRDLGFARTAGGGATGLTSKFWCRDWAWSHDGSRIAFVVGRSAGTSIWTVDVATRDIELLYKGFSRSPAYSPDGKWLAFAIPDVRSGFRIVVVDLATGKEKQIEVTSFDGKKIIWSPDSQRMYISSTRKSEAAVWSVGVDGTGLTRVTPKGTPSTAPALSPDGKQIACQVVLPSSYSPELTLFDTAGTQRAKLTARTSPSFWSPTWSPDGKTLAFQTDVRHTIELFTGTPAGRLGGARATINSPGSVSVSWFPDGQSLLVGDGGQLFTVRRSGGKDAVKPLPNLNAMVQDARLTGEEVIVTEWGARDASLSAVRLDGTGKRRITQIPAEKPAPAPAAQPSASLGLSSDSPIILASYRGGASLITIADPATGNPHADLGLMGPQQNRAVPVEPAKLDLWPAVSPDRSTIAFTRDNQIWLVNAKGTGERQATHLKADTGATRSLAGSVWSPDGKSLVFVAFVTTPDTMTLELWSFRTDGAQERLLYSEVVDTEYGAFYLDCTNPPAFLPGGERILFTSVQTGEPRIVSIGRDGGSLTEVVPAPSTFPALDPDGRRLAYVDLSSFHERIRVQDLKTGKRSGPLYRK